MHTRSISPYENRSCSGSTGYERSIASSSPHVTTIPGSFESPQPGHTMIANQAWSPPVIPSTEQPFTYTYPRSVTYQQPPVYSAGAPTNTSYSVWNTISSTVGMGCTTPDPAHQTIYASLWPSSGHGNFYPGPAHQQTAVPSTTSHVTSWQHYASEDISTGIAIDPYGRRYYTYDHS
jgi:hypothetical protein